MAQGRVRDLIEIIEPVMTDLALADRLALARARAAADPFTNAPLIFALEVSREVEAGGVTLDALEALATELGHAAFESRAERLAAYLGDCDPLALRERLRTLFGRLAEGTDFDAYRRLLATAPFGVVLTAHPTFAIGREHSDILVTLATGRDASGAALDNAQRQALLDRARHLPLGPSEPLTLDFEHDWSVAALHSAHSALEVVYEVAFEVARARWPSRWTALQPHLATLATWVGFDQDGRTDVTWQVSIGKRLLLKLEALERRQATLAGLRDGAEDEWRLALDAIASLIDRALETTRAQIEALSKVQAAEPATLATFARAMVDGRRTALIRPTVLMRRLEDALDAAPDEDARLKLATLRAGLATEGVSLARIQVRLNAGQLHNAIRRDVGLDTSPTDPANRRSYFAAIEGLIAGVRPVEINFADVATEPASARRLMMILAQMRKYVDASSPVRFLIAETETGFTLLTALYFARLFGVEDHVEISPLFETPDGFERGEKVIEEALRSRHFRDYLVRHGRIAIEFGFSDSGRFIGQLAATFRIERLRFKLAQTLEAHGLTGLEIVFFNTHGESLGRGGHPGGLADRFRYAAPPRSRMEFARIGVRVKEEDAFQGGEGYLPLLTPIAALATLTAALESVLVPDPEAEGDPIYDDPDFTSEFFATLEQDFASLVADPDYATLVGMFGTHLLPKTGSRPVQRQAGDGGRPRNLASVSELRAIPNNAVLQQLGYLANSLYGLGHAAEKDRATFARLREASPRFRRALALAAAAGRFSDIQVLEAYGACLDPALWIARAASANAPACDLAVAEIASRADMAEQLARVRQKLKAEDVRLHAAGLATALDGRLELLHALRVAAIQRLARLIVGVPDFNPRGELNLAAVQERLLRLNGPATLDRLAEFFPHRSDAEASLDFGEPSTYAAAGTDGYRREHEEVFAPMRQLHALIAKLSSVITLEIGACG